ncbi:MAG: GNAT family N-acetyltransferase [Gemmatimonadetes bacterium]|nr:GNAT family N-acetyltransferase [Gemmatimonadota bacterium]
MALRPDMQTDFVVRDASPDDAEAVATIYVDSWNAGFGHLMGKKEFDSELIERWRATLSGAPPARWWVAPQDGAIHGFVGIGSCRDPADTTLGEVDTIAVDPDHWRIGVGRVLMRRALEYLRLDGYLEGRLWTFAEYPRAAAFYESMGWSGFYPARADTSEKAHLGPGGVSWKSEGSTARNLSVRRSG